MHIRFFAPTALTMLTTSALGILFLLVRPAYAETIDFSYSGIDITNTAIAGSGSFTYAGSPTALTLASLTGFTFTDTFLAFGDGPSTFTYSLADLSSFSATLTGDTLLTLALQTAAIGGSNPTVFIESFQVSNLGPLGAQTLTAPGGVGPATTTSSSGHVSELGAGSAVAPEPSTFALFGTGVLGLAAAFRRRFIAEQD